MNITPKINHVLVLLVTAIFVIASCNDGRFKQGKTLYDFHCANCHMEDGTGLAEIYPPLNGSDYLMEDHTRLPHIIRYGIEGPMIVNGQNYNIPMPGIPELSATEISNITNYIMEAWTNDLGTMSFNEVLNSLGDAGN